MKWTAAFESKNETSMLYYGMNIKDNMNDDYNSIYYAIIMEININS